MSKAVLVARLGRVGDGAGEFRETHRLHVAVCPRTHHVIVADCFHDRIHVFDPNTGALLRSWGKHGSDLGELDDPSAIYVADSGDIYVAERNNHRVQVFSAEGTPLRKFGGFGHATGQLFVPSGVVVVESDNAVFVVDQGHRCVQRYTLAGVHESGFVPRNTEAEEEKGLDPSSLSLSADKKLFVGFANGFVRSFMLDGTFVRQFGDGVLKSPESVCAVDDVVLVVDNRMVMVFDQATGELLRWLFRFKSGCATDVAAFSADAFVVSGYGRVQIWHYLPQVWTLSQSAKRKLCQDIVKVCSRKRAAAKV